MGSQDEVEWLLLSKFSFGFEYVFSHRNDFTDGISIPKINLQNCIKPKYSICTLLVINLDP